MAANCVSAPSTGLAMLSGTRLCRKYFSQRALELREHREGREHRQHHRHQRHERDQRREGQAARGEAEPVFAKALAQRAQRVEPGPGAQRLQRARQTLVAPGWRRSSCADSCWLSCQHGRRLAAAPLARTRTRAVRRAPRSLAQPAGADRARPGLGAVARADRPRHAGAEGAAAAAAAGRPAARSACTPTAGLSLLVWLYFTEGVVRATSDAAGARAGLARGRCCACCCSPPARLHVRWRLRARRAARGRRPPREQALLDALRDAVGAAHVLTDGDLSAYELDWRKRCRGKRAGGGAARQHRRGGARWCAPARPHGAQHRRRRAATPGSSAAACPTAAARQVLLSLARMNRVRAIDAANLTITARGRLRAAGGAGGRGRTRAAVPAEPGRRRQLHDRRQPRHQRRRHAGAALRQRARAVPRARGGHRRRARSGTA